MSPISFSFIRFDKEGGTLRRDDAASFAVKGEDATFARMITESLIRKQFVHQTMAEGVGKIFDRQQQAFQASFSPRTGRLQQLLASRPWGHQATDTRYTVQVSMYTYLRFLDMQYRRQDGTKRRKKGLIYNKVAWPVLFREVFPELRYGLTDEVRRQLRTQLEQALKP